MKRDKLIRRMRRAHIAAQREHTSTISKMKTALAKSMVSGFDDETFTTTKSRSLKKLRNYTFAGWARYSVKARERCKHKRKIKVNKHWRQCRRCRLCIPRLGKPPKFIKLPPILKDVILPPRYEDDQRADLRGMLTESGIALNKFIRLNVIQYNWKTDPFIDRFSVELRFGKLGWKTVAVVYETHWYKILPLVQAANPKKPKKLFYKLQKKLGTQWPEPWLPSPWKRKGSWRLYWDKSTIATVKNGTVIYGKAKEKV